jgi:hypothetical protein
MTPTKFAIFANGSYWGAWDASSADAAKHDAAEAIGTDGNTDGLTAVEVTADEADALVTWAASGAPADECPIRA